MTLETLVFLHMLVPVQPGIVDLIKVVTIQTLFPGSDLLMHLVIRRRPGGTFTGADHQQQNHGGNERQKEGIAFTRLPAAFPTLILCVVFRCHYNLSSAAAFQPYVEFQIQSNDALPMPISKHKPFSPAHFISRQLLLPFVAIGVSAPLFSMTWSLS
jgi:hypothetical protein